MDKNAKWIWLDKKIYPQYQKSEITLFDKTKEKYAFVAAEFKYEKSFKKKIKKISIDISADVKFWLYMNGKYVGAGPVCAGGDYANTMPMPKQYYNTYELETDCEKIEFYVLVQKNTTVQCDTSQGRPGMIMSTVLTFCDGTTEKIVSSKDWLARKDNRRYANGKIDYTMRTDEWCRAEEVENIWNLCAAPIEMLAEDEIFPMEFSPVTVLPGETKTVNVEFDKIYSCYYHLAVSAEDNFTVQIADYEKDEKKAEVMDTIAAKSSIDFRSLQMTSVGSAKLYIINGGKKPLTVDKFSLYFDYYPIHEEGNFECSDTVLNKAYDMGKWALKICRQTIELDSPKHQENLGCTGDYMIASLMNYFTYGDTKLTRLDIIRTADYLRISNGYMFHTSYSMMWIMMLYDYYMFSADRAVLNEVKDVLQVLLERFCGYTDENGIITDPPSYMFLDWLEIDGVSLHHPPAALGQAALNAFYIGGLERAAEIFKILGDNEEFEKYNTRCEKVKKSFNEYFYDTGKRLYFDGLNEDYPTKKWIPKNVDKRYFSQHTNSLAVLFDIAPKDEQKDLIERILNDETLIKPQPYFMHFVLDAIYKAGLFEKYGIEQLHRWEDMTKFPKGLQEGWYDKSGYGFDYSHVWGGTPTYQLPSKIMGFEMKEAGFKEILLNPQTFGLDYANVKMPTPYGYICVELKKGEKPIISVPDEIKVHIKDIIIL